MNKRVKKQGPSDLNEIAFRVVSEAISEESKVKPDESAAVAAGRKGGLKGGVARAVTLSPERRKEIAQRAAQARWGNEERRAAYAARLSVTTCEL